jgi:hypothetical protein
MTYLSGLWKNHNKVSVFEPHSSRKSITYLTGLYLQKIKPATMAGFELESGRQNAPYNFISRISSVLKSMARITHLIPRAPIIFERTSYSKVRNLLHAWTEN